MISRSNILLQAKAGATGKLISSLGRFGEIRESTACVTRTLLNVVNVTSPATCATYPQIDVLRSYAPRRLFSSTASEQSLESDEILTEVKNGVRKMTLNRPEKKNAFTMDMVRRMLYEIRLGDADEATIVIVLTGTGDYFTSGMDLGKRGLNSKGGQKSSESDPKLDAEKAAKKKPGAGVAKFLSRLVECRKPLIALVNGPAVGFGVTMLSHFDAVYASDKATFHTTFSRFGLPPELASTYTFPRIMGYAKASNLLIFDKKMTAEEAYRCGFVSRVIQHSRFVEETTKIVDSYGQLPVKSLMYSKELIRGRTKNLMYQVSEKEQSFFDPVRAREIIAQFMASKNKSL